MKTKLFLASLLFTGFVHAQDIELEPFAQGLNMPVDIAFANDDRMFVVEQDGLIKMLINVEGEVTQSTFLNVSSLIATSGSERGLLGMAFHPDFENNGYFFINYTNTSNNTVIARYTVNSADPNVADPNSGVILLTVTQPFSNHNGGCLRFGPDGYLYIGMGDGGDGGDPGNRAQNINTLLGKMLRLDVDGAAPYTSPADNPYIGVDGADEIWAIGMRNPWKFSFNRLNGDLWIGDVGQELWEEINKVPSTSGGLNFGWRCYEGTHTYNTSECSGITGLTAPLVDYSSGSGSGNCSVIGGYVYTGTLFPNLQGKYLFADYCSSKIGMIDEAGGAITWTSAFPGTNFVTFGEDHSGELYIAGISDGKIYHIIDNSVSGTTDFAGGSYTVYPNPAGTEVFLDLNNILSTASVSILDIRGKLLVQQDVAEGSSRIDTSALQSGIYMMKLEASGNTKYQKLVIR
ncbi:cadherin [Flavobacterium album]|uniref:Cadherin n=1 Tax=Flavobacterium album TaxID=2175091 RepID=A0A2S1QW20_9FLAO|nr:PQQ-dependent sugar dehydrogenase [Flavobacterium album]AWH84608.1 cadherin [Flavobacterium album]